MKNTITILLLLISTIGISQDRFTLSTYTEPHIYFKDGFNIGGALEYQGKILYIKAQTFYYPNLRGITYHDLEGVIGVNYRNRWDELRIFTGLKLGNINRQGWGHPKWGLEAGIEYYFKTFYIGLQSSYNRRTDGRVWESNAVNYWSWGNGFKIGFYW